jgi:hypothetical protein
VLLLSPLAATRPLLLAASSHCSCLGETEFLLDVLLRGAGEDCLGENRRCLTGEPAAFLLGSSTHTIRSGVGLLCLLAMTFGDGCLLSGDSDDDPE